MRSVTGSLYGFAMQHAHRELHLFSSTTIDVLISEVEILWIVREKGTNRKAFFRGLVD